jgi:hypothetical protein
MAAGKMAIRICSYLTDFMSNNSLTFWHVQTLYFTVLQYTSLCHMICSIRSTRMRSLYTIDTDVCMHDPYSFTQPQYLEWLLLVLQHCGFMIISFMYLRILMVNILITSVKTTGVLDLHSLYWRPPWRWHLAAETCRGFYNSLQMYFVQCMSWLTWWL